MTVDNTGWEPRELAEKILRGVALDPDAERAKYGKRAVEALLRKLQAVAPERVDDFRSGAPVTPDETSLDLQLSGDALQRYQTIRERALLREQKRGLRSRKRGDAVFRCLMSREWRLKNGCF